MIEASPSPEGRDLEYGMNRFADSGGSSRKEVLSRVTRRRTLLAGSLGAAGLYLPELFRGRAWSAESSAPRAQVAGPGFGRAKSCVLCFLFGAPAHQDIWDLKPNAPSDIRGEFSPIETNVAGISLGEHVPKIAKIADRLSILRSVQHPDNTHTVAMHYMLTGRRHAQPSTNPRALPTDFPTFGAVLQYLRPFGARLPAGISLNSPANQVSANNHIFPGFFAGTLGALYDPLFVSQDPSANDFRPMPIAEGEGLARLTEARRLRDSLDTERREWESRGGVGAFQAYYERAFDLVTSRDAQNAFDLEREPRELRDRYGMSAFGQGLLLARRLVEAEVPLVTVNWARDDAFWDTHQNNFKDLKEKLLPPFDAGFSTFLDDLAERGLLDETLVVCLGEFGRTPRINGNAGRDHWAACNSVVFAGGGVRGGVIHGASDRIAAYPATAPIFPEDLAATVYHALGIDPRAELRDPLGRPMALTEGRVLHEIF